MKQLIFLLLFFPCLTIAQETAFFETTIYFEDAIGNKDSIIVGYDPEANTDYNPDFGEVDISDIPFDSVFEVRAQHFFNWNGNGEIQSKKFVGFTEEFVNNEFCLSVEPAIFFINAKHQPVKVYWDQKTYLNNDCHTASFLTPALGFGFVDEWWKGTDFPIACMAEQDTMSFILDNPGDYYYLDTKVEGLSGLTRIQGISYVIKTEANYHSPCRHVVDTEKVLSTTDVIKVYPNPTNGMVYIESGDLLIAEAIIFSVLGKRIGTKDIEDDWLNLANLASGLYYVQFLDKQGNGVVKKIVKL